MSQVRPQPHGPCVRMGSGAHPRLQHRRAPRRLPSHPVLAALFALAWLILRSVGKPARLSYPCQRAALGSVSLAFGLPLAHLLHRALKDRRARIARLAVGIALLAIIGLGGLADTGESRRLPLRAGDASLKAPQGYAADLYVVDGAGGPQGDHHLGVDELLACAAASGLKFYRSETNGPEAGPDGVVGANDVVLIKVNQQWPERGGTNTDVLKGLIARIVEHPDGFTGEVVIVENTQGVGRLDWPASNAEDHGQSVLGVVAHFAGQGWSIAGRLWDGLRNTAVAEYSDGDLRDGYVVGPYEPTSQVRVSYPKFRTPRGEYVSLKYGIWNPDSARYDDHRLTFLNVPVLKCHGTYGVTAAVKHHVGTMTTSLSTNTHVAVQSGGLGSFLAQVRMPDLNILDAVYVLARPDRGPACSYAEATRLDKLVAGRDPVAIDLWATANILVPAMIANGYVSYPMQDPYNPGSAFRIYLDNTTRELLAAGVPVTNDLANVIVHTCQPVQRGPDDDDLGDAGAAYPNPFAAATTIRFSPRVSGIVRLDVFDVTGRSRRSIERTVRAGFTEQILWDGRDDDDRPMPPGTYYYRLRGAGLPVSGKAALAR